MPASAGFFIFIPNKFSLKIELLLIEDYEHQTIS